MKRTLTTSIFLCLSYMNVMTARPITIPYSFPEERVNAFSEANDDWAFLGEVTTTAQNQDPWVGTWISEIYKALDGEPGSLMAQSLEKKGFHVLAYLENDYRGFSNSKRPIHHPSDLSGLKLRVPASPVLAEWMKSVNCDPTIMPYNEVYSAIQTGVVDGQDNGILLSYTHKIFEVNKYYSLTNHIYCPSPIMISSKVWKSMPEDLQKILTDAAVDTRDYQRKLNVEYREKYENSAKNDGIQINDLSADELKEFVESASKVWPKFADEIDKNIYDSMMKTIGKAE